MTTKKTPRISVLNWMGTLFLCAIPGVNLLYLLLTIIFAKTPSKKNFAWALLLWTVLLCAAASALLLIFPEQSAELANWLRAYAAGGNAQGLLP